MSFDVGPIGNKPVIRENQGTQDGGAGNLGYMRVGEEDEEKKHQQALSKSVFDEKPDTYEEHSNIEEDDFSSNFSLSKLIAQIILFFKNLINRIFNK